MKEVAFLLKNVFDGPETLLCSSPIQGQYLTVKKLGFERMNICEIEAWGKEIETFWTNCLTIF